MNTGSESAPHKLRIKSEFASVRTVREKLHAIAVEIGFSESETAHLNLAVDEALVNVIEHGYGGPCGEMIDVDISRIERHGRSGVGIRIRDYGKQVDPEVIRGRELDDVRPGGLGVHIIQTVMDEVRYGAAEDRGMVLEMVKLKPA